MVRKRAGDAPSVAATRSYRALTCSNPARAVRTRSGSPMIAIASTTAFHVKTTSIPSRSSTPPKRPRRLRSISRINPWRRGASRAAATRTSRPARGRETSAARAATRGPRPARISAVAPAAHARVNQVIRQILHLRRFPSHGRISRRARREAETAEHFFENSGSCGAPPVCVLRVRLS